VTLTPYPLLVPWSRKSRAIHLLPLWAVQPVQSLSACTRVDFTFYLLTGQQVECDLVNYSQIIVTNSEACKTNQCACLDRLWACSVEWTIVFSNPHTQERVRSRR